MKIFINSIEKKKIKKHLSNMFVNNILVAMKNRIKCFDDDYDNNDSNTTISSLMFYFQTQQTYNNV